MASNAGKLRWLFIGCVFVLISIYFLTSFLLFNFSNDFSTMRNLPKRSADFPRQRMAFKKKGFRIKFNHTLQKRGTDFWRSIVPRYECPKALLEKIGGMAKVSGQDEQVRKNKTIADWGKWTCGLKSLFGKGSGAVPGANSPCVMMSFGVDYDNRKDHTFEMEAVKKWNCSVYMFGHSEIKNLGPFFINSSSDSNENFTNNYKFGLDGKENWATDKNKLKKLLLQVGNETGGNVNVLKVVVAGGTYQQLGHLLKSYKKGLSKISQIFLEFHVKEWGNYVVQESESGEPEMIVAVLKKLEQLGFRSFKKNVIKKSEYKGCCREFAFVNLQIFLNLKKLNHVF